MTRIVFLSLLGWAVFANAETIALKNHLQIYEGILAATGIDPTTKSFREVYAAVKDRLPKDGSIDELDPTMLLGLERLSGAACEIFIERESNLPADQRVAHRAIDFSTSPNANTAGALATVDRYAELFWLRKLSAAESAFVGTQWNAMVAPLPNDPAGLKTALKLACLSVASSLDAILF